MNAQRIIWNHLIDGPRSDYMLRAAMWRVARGLSDLSGRTFSHGDPQITRVPISQVAAHAGDPETEQVGVYLVMSEGLYGQTLLILPIASALHLADLLLGDPLGTATELGVMERSALAEVGNLAASRFLNTMAAQNPQSKLMRPSPPAVMVDMLGAILNVIVTPVAAVRDDLLIIETDLHDTQLAVQGCFWVIPDPALKDLAA
jgi:chemotaxis protein CheC